MKRIAIFASGKGSNAQKIIEFFSDKKDVEVSLIVSNNTNAGVLDLAQEWGLEKIIIDRDTFKAPETFIKRLKRRNIELIVLAGFLWLLPPALVQAFPKKIVNIHPALLPKFGGKGMYGMRVHEAVKRAGEGKSGITIHYVNERYDEGMHIFQATCELGANDSPDEIARKVLVLEHKFYPRIIHNLLIDKRDQDAAGRENAN